MKKYFIALSVIGLTFLNSCTFSSRTFGTESGSQIDNNERNTIFAKSEKIYRAIKQGKVSVFKDMAFEDVKKYFDNFTVEEMDAIGVDKNANDLRMEAEYLVANNGLSKTETVTAENYTLSFPLVTTEAYIALFTVPTRIDKSRALVMTVYIKDKGEWKLLSLRIGSYTYDDKTCPQSFQAAKDSYAKGNLLEAMERMTITKTLSTPGGNLLTYNGVEEMKAFGNKIALEVKEKFKLPLNITFGADQGAISDIGTIVKAKAFPAVEIEMKTLAPAERLKTEMAELNKHIDQYLPGVANGADSIVYYIATKSAEQSATTQITLPALHS